MEKGQRLRLWPWLVLPLFLACLRTLLGAWVYWVLIANDDPERGMVLVLPYWADYPLWTWLDGTSWPAMVFLFMGVILWFLIGICLELPWIGLHMFRAMRPTGEVSS